MNEDVQGLGLSVWGLGLWFRALNPKPASKVRSLGQDVHPLSIRKEGARIILGFCLGWPLKPFEKYSYIVSLIKPLGKILNFPGAYPVARVMRTLCLCGFTPALFACAASGLAPHISSRGPT